MKLHRCAVAWTMSSAHLYNLLLSVVRVGEPAAAAGGQHQLTLPQVDAQCMHGGYTPMVGGKAAAGPKVDCVCPAGWAGGRCELVVCFDGAVPYANNTACDCRTAHEYKGGNKALGRRVPPHCLPVERLYEALQYNDAPRKIKKLASFVYIGLFVLTLLTVASALAIHAYIKARQYDAAAADRPPLVAAEAECGKTQPAQAPSVSGCASTVATPGYDASQSTAAPGTLPSIATGEGSQL